MQTLISIIEYMKSDESVREAIKAAIKAEIVTVTEGRKIAREYGGIIL